jgi:hypothetical protein
MSEEIDRIRELKEKLIQSGYKAVEELIKVAEAPIIKKKGIDLSDELAAEKMKNAAAAKKTAMFDAYDILEKIHEQEKLLKAADGEPTQEEKPKKKPEINFAEGRAK